MLAQVILPAVTPMRTKSIKFYYKLNVNYFSISMKFNPFCVKKKKNFSLKNYQQTIRRIMMYISLQLRDKRHTNPIKTQADMGFHIRQGLQTLQLLLFLVSGWPHIFPCGPYFLIHSNF